MQSAGRRETWNARRSTSRPQSRDFRQRRSQGHSRRRCARFRTASRCARAAASRRSPGASTASASTASRTPSKGLGLERGQTYALMLTNRPEFHIADTAALSLGATPFSLYQTLTPGSDRLPAQRLGSRDRRDRARLPRPRAGREGAGARRCATSCRGSTVEAAPGGEATLCSHSTSSCRRRATPKRSRPRATRSQPDDLLTLIYTSGTTGPPKGVQLTHHNMMFAVKTFDEVIDFPDGARVVSYLPMAHIAERAVGHYLPIVLAHTVTCCPNPREVIAYLPEVRPTWFFAVPRIWEKLKAGLEAMVASEQDAERKKGLRVGARRRPQEGARRAGRRAGLRRARGRARRRPTSSCSRRSAASSGSTSSRRSTSAPRRRRSRCSSSSTRSGSRSPSSGGSPRAPDRAPSTCPDAIKLGTVGQVTPGHGAEARRRTARS